MVKYQDTNYIFSGCVLRKNNIDFYYQAELKSKTAKSIIICKLGDVEIE